MRLMLAGSNLEIKAEFSNINQIKDIISNMRDVRPLKLKNGEYINSYYVDRDFQISSNGREVKVFILRGDVLFFVDENLNPISKPRYI